MANLTFPSPMVALTATLAAVCCAAQADTAPAASTVAPSEVVATWEKGVWTAWGDDYPFTGLKSEDRYNDPKIAPPNRLPFRPEWAAKWQSIREQAFEGRNVIDIGTRCVPLGIPYMSIFGIVQILFAPDRVVITGFADSGTRIIYTDGRPHEAGVDPSYNGDAIGHWEGKTLVVETTSIRADTYLEPGLPHSDAVRDIERWTYVDPDTIHMDVTVYDNKEFTAPLHATATYKRDPKGRIHESVCENNRDRQVNGATTLIGADGKPLVAPAKGKAHYKIVQQNAATN
jgi:hypothetical protein